MSTPIIEKVLGNNKLYTENYVEDTFMLTKSIVIVFHQEASLYNDYLEIELGLKVNKKDKNTWRYYKHLVGEYHEVDVPIHITSWDNGQDIIINKETMRNHKKTRNELLLYGDLYQKTIANYPDQELLLRSIISDSLYTRTEDVLELDNFTILSYNSALVEDVETNLILGLENRVKRYAVHKLLPQYNLADNLFLASMYHVLYSFLLTSLLSIRLSNVKTPRAHSYHILSYFASHHSLDAQYKHLGIEERLFLYRNLMYLNSYAGTNEAFDVLVEELLTKKDIAILGYTVKQNNEPNSDGSMGYMFSKELLNSRELVYEDRDIDLDEFSDKDRDLALSNDKEYQFNKKVIDEKLKNTLHNRLETKLLDINITDSSNEVRHILEDALLNYWAYYLYSGNMDFIIKFTEPSNGETINLTTKDAFKLFTIALHYHQGVKLTKIPSFNAIRVVRPNLPTKLNVLSSLGLNPGEDEEFDRILDYVLFSVPGYEVVLTPFDFKNMVLEKYLFLLGNWFFTSNVGDLELNWKVKTLMEKVHYSVTYTQNDETVDQFLGRIKYEKMKDFDKGLLVNIVNGLLSEVSSDTMAFLSTNQNTNDAIISIFEKFKSYSTQFSKLIDVSDSIITNLGFPHVTPNIDYKEDITFVRVHVPFATPKTMTRFNYQVGKCQDVDGYYSKFSIVDVDLAVTAGSDGGYDSVAEVASVTPTVLNDDIWEVTPSSQDHLFFLATN